MGSWLPSLVDSFRNLRGYPDYFSAGPPAFSPHTFSAKLPMVSKEWMVANDDDAIRFVTDRMSEKTDFVKIITELGCEIGPIAKMAGEARKAGKMSIAHAVNTDVYELSHEAKVDVLTHAPLDTAISDDVAKKIAEAGQVCVPTLVVGHATANTGFRPKDSPKYAKESVKKLHQAGVPILTGTDSNEGPRGGPGPPAVVNGKSFSIELELLAEAGLSPVEVLRAATVKSAKHFRLHDRGSVEMGKRADLVLLDQNPLEDIAAFKLLKGVWCGGHPIQLHSAKD